MTAGEQEFINQMTRKQMVGWCHAAAQAGTGIVSIQDGDKSPYTIYATSKKWITLAGAPSTGYQHFKILSGGWDTAARFLKR